MAAHMVVGVSMISRLVWQPTCSQTNQAGSVLLCIRLRDLDNLKTSLHDLKRSLDKEVSKLSNAQRAMEESHEALKDQVRMHLLTILQWSISDICLLSCQGHLPTYSPPSNTQQPKLWLTLIADSGTLTPLQRA